MADFVIDVRIDATKTKNGVREAKSAARSMQTDYENLIKVVEKYQQQISQVQKFTPQIQQAQKLTSGDSAYRNALKEIQSLQRQNLAAEKAITRQIELDAKQRANYQIREAKRAATEIANSLNKSQQSSSGGGLFSSILGGNLVAQGVSATIGLVKTGGAAWLDYASKLEQARIGFTTMTGSAATANQHLVELQNFAKSTPFEFGELVTASQKMQGVGIAATKVVPILKDVGNILAASGRIDSLQDATKALSDIQAKGKLAGQEIIQLANAGIPAGKILAEAFNKPQSEIIKLAENGQISADMLFFALHRVSEAKFGDAMEKQSKTFGGALSNITDALFQASEVAFRPFYKEISEFAVKAANEVNKSEGDITGVGGIIGKYIVAGLTSAIKTGVAGAVQYLVAASKGEASLTLGTQSLLEGIANGFGYNPDLTPFFAPNKAAADKKRLLESLDTKTVTNNGITTSFDPITNTIKQIGGAVEKVPDMASQLNAKQAQQEVAALADSVRKFELAQLENSSRIRIARLNAQRATSPEDRIAVANGVFAEDSALLRAQKAALQKNFADEIAANVGNTTKIKQIVIEKNIAIGKIDTDLKLKQIQNAKDVADFEIESIEKRRNAQLKLLQIQQTELGQNFASASFNVKRKIDFGIDIDGSFAELKAITEKNYNELFENTRSQYLNQLKQVGLSNDDRVNLEKELFLRLQDLAESNRQHQLEISDSQYREQLRQSQEFAQIQENQAKSAQEALSFLNGAFDPANFQVGLAKSVFDKFVVNTNDTLDIIIERARLELNAVAEIANGFLRASEITKNPQLKQQYLEKFDKQSTIHKGKADAFELERNPTELKKTTYALLELSNAFDRSSIAIDDFDRASKLSLELQQQYSAESLAKRIKNEQEREKIALKYGDNVTAGFIRANIEVLSNEEENNAIRNRIALLNQYRNSYEGLLEANNKLKNNDTVTVLGIQDQARKDILSQQNAELAKRITLEYQLANSPIINATRVENALLEKQLEIRGREEQSLIRVNAAKLELAQKSVLSTTEVDALTLEGLSSRVKSASEAFADFRLSIADSVFSPIDSVLERINSRLDKLPIGLREITKGFASLFGSIIKQMANKYLLRLFGLDSGTSTTGNPTSVRSGGGSLVNSITNLLTGNRQQTPIAAGGSSFAGNPIAQLIGGGGSPAGLPVSGRTFQSGLSLLNPIQGPGRPGAANASGGLAKFLGLGSGKGITGALGSLLPGLGIGLGGSLGGQSGAGNILGSIGGAAGGLLGSALLTGSASTLFGGAFAAGGALSIGGLSAALSATVVLAPIAGVLLASALILKRNAARRRDERTRNQATLDAFSALDKLISDVGADKIDGASALAQADQIRQQYLATAGSLKDKKTRNIALADVSRLDSKIATLKAAITTQQKRKERLATLVPTFAQGGQVSNFVSSNFRNNPLGYISGPGGSRSDSIRAFFPKAQTFADISNREYVLDAATTSGIGVRTLDAIRRDKGRNLNALIQQSQRFGRPDRLRYADGGLVAPSGGFVAPSISASGSLSSGEMKVENNITVNLTENGNFESVDVKSYLVSREGKQAIIGTVREHVQTQRKGDGLVKDINDINR